MRLLTLAGSALLLLALGALRAQAQEQEQKQGEALAFEDIASGVWGWDVEGLGCGENPHTISFSEDRSRMVLRYAHGVEREAPLEVVYRILAEAPGFLRMAMEGEERTTETGELVVWDLVLLSVDSYCWHRTDWQSGGCTQPTRRCAGGPDEP